MPHIEENQTQIIYERALKSFRILGTASLDEVIKRLDEVANQAASDKDLETIKDEYYRKGGLAGRMLLRAWEQRNPDRGKRFLEWLRDDPVPQSDESATEKGSCALWRPSPPALPPAHLALLEKAGFPHPTAWHTPFGPDKAEDDPRLRGLKFAEKSIPALFYNKMSWYTDITAERHSLFYAPPGCGRTAAIWNARYTHRITSYKPALSLYLLLRPPFEPAHLLKLVADALGRALCCALVEDAYWLMAADRETQADIGRFLLWWAGDLTTLVRRLRNGGLQIAESLSKNTTNEEEKDRNCFYDGRLLTDVFISLSPLNHVNWDDLVAITHATRLAIKKAYSDPEKEWDYPIYLWLDSSLSEDTISQELPRLWDNEFLRCMGNLKIFTRHKFPDKEQIRMDWDADHFYEMLDYRWEKLQANLFLTQEHLGQDPEDFKKAVSQRAKFPRDIIRKGNSLLEALGKSLAVGG